MSPAPVTIAQPRGAGVLPRSVALLCGAALVVSLAALLGLLGAVVGRGVPFLFGSAGVAGREALLFGLVGSLQTVGIAAIFGIPIGIAVGAVISERRRDSRLARMVDVTVTVIAESPPIGFGLAIFWLIDRLTGPGHAVIVAASTLLLLAVPLSAVAARRSFNAVPRAVRTAALALGASRIDVFRHCVLPNSRPRLIDEMSGVVARLLGEAAPLLIVLSWEGASGAAEALMTLPTQIFQLAGSPDPATAGRAAAAIVVLLLLLAAVRGAGAALARWAHRADAEDRG